MSAAATTHSPTPRRVALAALAAVMIAMPILGVLATAAAQSAHASANQLSMMMDDDQLIYGSAKDRDLTLYRMKQYGVDAVRVTVLWSVVAQDAMKGSRAKKFRAADPKTYPHYTWDRYDDLVEAAKVFGITVLFNVTGPGPAWAQRPTKDKLSARSYKPYEGKYYEFVKALGTRYSGHYHDENGTRQILPRVNFWAIWNEPNQGASLTPQSEYNPIVKKVIPTAPIIYRRLLYAGIAGLRSTGHAKDIILFGDTAPLGKDALGPRKQLRPKLFLRELFCLKPDMQPYTGLEAKARECDLFKKKGPFKSLAAYAHHPYTQKNPPTVRDSNPDSVNMANIGDLPTLLDQIAAKTGLIPSGLTVALTENGWQTLPPDPYYGISLVKQAEYMNLSDELAYFNPRISAVTQFLFRDTKPRPQYGSNLKLKWFTWQSGITYSDGSPKPSLAAYALQINATYVATNPDGSVRSFIWGQVRGADKGKPTQVYLQYRPPGTTTWRNIETLPVNQSKNFFTTIATAPGPGVWRAIWIAPAKNYYFQSRESIVSP
jgi:hypothetical protein